MPTPQSTGDVTLLQLEGDYVDCAFGLLISDIQNLPYLLLKVTSLID